MLKEWVYLVWSQSVSTGVWSSSTVTFCTLQFSRCYISSVLNSPPVSHTVVLHWLLLTDLCWSSLWYTDIFNKNIVSSSSASHSYSLWDQQCWNLTLKHVHTKNSNYNNNYKNYIVNIHTDEQLCSVTSHTSVLNAPAVSPSQENGNWWPVAAVHWT